jgi:hypothetical protein
MKRVLLFFAVILATAPLAQGHPYVPLSGFFSGADKVYIGMVTSSRGRKVTFGYIEVLRGAPVDHLALTLHEDEQESFPEGTKWLLVRDPAGMPNVLGESFDGPDGEWIPGQIIGTDSGTYVVTGAFPDSGIKLTKLPDGRDGMILSEVRAYLKDHPYKK